MLNPIVFLAFMALSEARQDWEACGLPAGCFCSVPILHEIQCQSIKVFPIFDEVIKPGVTSVTIYASQIVGLAPFKKDEWDRLKHLNLIDTPLLACDSIAQLQRPGLRILSECVCDKPAEEEEEEGSTISPPPAGENGSTICLAFLLVIVFGVVFAMSSVLYMICQPTPSMGHAEVPSDDLSAVCQSTEGVTSDEVPRETWV
jgi:hypothetical protein